MLYDCVIFFNELDLLELRMLELQDVVDRFVVVEAPITFAGNPKPLVFGDNRARFGDWSERIVHVVVDDVPRGSDPWARERHQRNAIRRGLAGANADDGVIISDVDEIPKADVVRRWHAELGPWRFEQLFCYYWINCVGGTWTGSRILPFSQIGRYSDFNEIRCLECPVFENGGWHFSYLGGPDAITSKLEAYSHQDLNVPKFKDKRYLSQVTSLGIDLFGRSMQFRFWEIDDRFPASIRTETSRFHHLVCAARFHEDWCPPEQLVRLAELCTSVKHLSGALLEIGSWEGRTTVLLAQTCHPDLLIAVDTWLGNEDEDPDHSTVHSARERDIYKQFLTNVRALTKGNVRPVREDAHAFLRALNGPVKFAYIDASHDYSSVKRSIDALMRVLVSGGVLCGSDFSTATCNRHDLSGGVERAVRESLDGFQTANNLWWWRKSEKGYA